MSECVTAGTAKTSPTLMATGSAPAIIKLLSPPFPGEGPRGGLCQDPGRAEQDCGSVPESRRPLGGGQEEAAEPEEQGEEDMLH